MSGLNDSQLAVIRAILDSAPDNALGTLNKALSAQAGPGAMGEIQRMVRGEVSDRRARDLTFAPLLPLCPKAPPPWTQQTFPARTLPLLWSAVASERPELVQAARAAANVRQPEDLHVEAFDLVCREAAAGLRCPSGTGYAPVAAFLDAATPDGAQLFGSYLDLTPLCRSVLEQMPDWLARMTEERAAGVRVAYNDAVEIAPDAGPRFFELMQAQLGEPWLILRLLSAVMFRPSDTYAASSELACFGDRLLDYVGRQIDALRKFDPEAGASAGVAAAEAARIAVLTLSEFEHSLELSKVSKWGGLISRYKQDLAMLVEIRFRKTDDLVALALPLKPPRHAARLMRGVPKLTEDPQARLVNRAHGALAFLQQTHTSAAAGGYSALRNKIVEKVAERLDHYVEDLLEVLRDPNNSERTRARTFLDIAADCLAYVRDEKAAQIVRRRAAA